MEFHRKAINRVICNVILNISQALNCVYCMHELSGLKSETGFLRNVDTLILGKNLSSKDEIFRPRIR